ncbi:MAG: hypothetical protein ACXVEF_34890 [Polyangiales bacterium]
MRALLLLSVMLAGCMSKAEKEDIENICFASERSGANAEKSTSEKAVKMAQFLKKNLQTDTWKKFFEKAATMNEGKRTLTIRKAADEAGIKDCPILDNR